MTTVVRVCEATYDATLVVKEGIQVLVSSCQRTSDGRGRLTFSWVYLAPPTLRFSAYVQLVLPSEQPCSSPYVSVVSSLSCRHEVSPRTGLRTRTERPKHCVYSESGGCLVSLVKFHIID